MKLKTIRLEKGLTQEKTAQLLGVSRRTYVTYEKDESKIPPMKLEYFLHTLKKYGVIDETHGILTLDAINKICADVFKEYNVEYAYLFGSYAKGVATEIIRCVFEHNTEVHTLDTRFIKHDIAIVENIGNGELEVSIIRSYRIIVIGKVVCHALVINFKQDLSHTEPAFAEIVRELVVFAFVTCEKMFLYDLVSCF